MLVALVDLNEGALVEMRRSVDEQDQRFIGIIQRVTNLKGQLAHSTYPVGPISETQGAGMVILHYKNVILTDPQLVDQSTS